ncbi:hypothetical protein BJV74DRAFT_795063 [Russula compacta]|nr:hypothetical protein BJV74DRAFT_795063 [Russula compacta]
MCGCLNLGAAIDPYYVMSSHCGITSPQLSPSLPERSTAAPDSLPDTSTAQTDGPSRAWNTPKCAELHNIFDFYLLECQSHPWKWVTLVHVCREWRQIILTSPRRLDLRRLLCTEKTPVKEMLRLSPALPIVIKYSHKHPRSLPALPEDQDNLIAALQHQDRELFPALTSLMLGSNDETSLVLPDEFLAGAAPRLQRVWLEGMAFPALPKLFLSDLVELHLWNIPVTGYISPETIVTYLSTLTKLRYLFIGFHSPSSRPHQRDIDRPPPTRTVLLTLTQFCFHGVSEYLEDFVSRIDAPHLSFATITFFNQLIFDIPQLPQLICRTEKLKSPNRATVVFNGDDVVITFYSLGRKKKLVAKASRYESRPENQTGKFHHWRRCVASPPLFSPTWDGSKSTKVAFSEKLGPFVAAALQDLGRDRAAEVLPTLDSLFLQGAQPSGSVQDAIQPFVTARQLSGHPVAISDWETGWTR